MEKRRWTEVSNKIKKRKKRMGERKNRGGEISYERIQKVATLQWGTYCVEGDWENRAWIIWGDRRRFKHKGGRLRLHMVWRWGAGGGGDRKKPSNRTPKKMETATNLRIPYVPLPQKTRGIRLQEVIRGDGTLGKSRKTKLSRPSSCPFPPYSSKTN